MKYIKYLIFYSYILGFFTSIHAEYNHISGCVVPEEEPSSALEFFLYPNELEAYLLRDYLKEQEGILISVGTFRTLFNATMGNFTRIIMLDNDELINKFNKANLDLISLIGQSPWSTLQQRLVYAALLAQRQFSIQDIDLVIASTHPPSFANQIQNLLSLLKKRSVFPKEQPIIDPSLGADLNGRLSEAIGRFMGVGADSQKNRVYDLEDLSEINASMTFWHSDEAWQKIQTLLADNRISVVMGDLKGQKTLKGIRNCLNQVGFENTPLLFDVSNALDYFIDNKSDYQKFIDNISLFNNRRVTILLTSKRLMKTSSWVYFSVPGILISDWPTTSGRIAKSNSNSVIELFRILQIVPSNKRVFIVGNPTQ
ncbi:MAG: hypothetical protein KC505_09915 [Myxococcales bacterium]|nr:hypothetical protein [Myxococcales bacterium]USN50938.1 MAG: hypothetical protein H6731_00535 [Myxococcales bacterium]